MANRLYIYTAKKAQSSAAVDEIIEAKYELPLYFYPLFVGEPKIGKDSNIYADRAAGVAFFKAFYNFLEKHADKLDINKKDWKKAKKNMFDALEKIAEDFFMLELSDIYSMDDKPAKEQAATQLADIFAFNQVMQDAMHVDNPALLDQIVDVRRTGYEGFKACINDFDFGWDFFSAQFENSYGFPEIFKEKGKWGIKTAKGKILTPPEYDNIYAFDENTNLCVAEKAGKFCYFDTKGKPEFAAVFDDAFDFNHDFDESDKSNDNKNDFTAIVKIKDLYGLINRQGNIILAPQWDDLTCILFTTQFFAVKKNGVWGVINHKFELIVAPQYPYAPRPDSDYGHSYYIVGPDEAERKAGELDIYLSKKWQPFELGKNKKIAETFASGDMIVTDENNKFELLGLRNQDNKVLLETIYKKIVFKFGLDVYFVQQDKKKGLYHPQNGWLLPCEYDQLEAIVDIYHGFAEDSEKKSVQNWVARKGKQYGLYNSQKQQWILTCEHGKIIPFAKNVVGVSVASPADKAGLWVHNATTGLALAGPYVSLSDREGNLSFAAVLAFSANQVFTVGQTGLVNPLKESEAEQLKYYLDDKHYFSDEQSALIKNASSKKNRADFLAAQANQAEEKGQIQQALDLYLQAAAINPIWYTSAGYLLGQHAGFENPPLTRHYYELAAKAGDVMAINNLGDCYLNGNGGEQNSQKALALFVEADKKGELLAAANLGNYYYKDGENQDHAMALKYYLKANRQYPHPLEIAYIYETMLKDYASALMHYEKAAKDGEGYAYNRIGKMWEEGLLGAVNVAKAQDYYQKAMFAETSEAYAGLNLAKLLINTDKEAAKKAFQFSLDHQDVVEGLTEFGKEQGWL